jgi:hypothetical protein
VELATGQLGRPLLVAHVSHMQYCMTQWQTCHGVLDLSCSPAAAQGGAVLPTKPPPALRTFFQIIFCWFVCCFASTVPACHAVLALLQDGANSCCLHTFLHMLRSVQECSACSTVCLQHRDCQLPCRTTILRELYNMQARSCNHQLTLMGFALHGCCD